MHKGSVAPAEEPWPGLRPQGCGQSAKASAVAGLRRSFGPPADRLLLPDLWQRNAHLMPKPGLLAQAFRTNSTGSARNHHQGITMVNFLPTPNNHNGVKPTCANAIQRESFGLLPPASPVTACGSRRRKSQGRPETIWQARLWDATKRHYISLGLCPLCASQAAWGHQQGFTRVNPPCLACLPVVLTFPVNEPGEWRSNSPRRGAPFSAALTALRS